MLSDFPAGMHKLGNDVTAKKAQRHQNIDTAARLEKLSNEQSCILFTGHQGATPASVKDFWSYRGLRDFCEQFPDVFTGSVAHFRSQLKLSRLTEGVWNVSKSKEPRPDRQYVLQTRVFVHKQKNEGKTQTLPSVWPLKGQGQSSLTCFTLTWNAAMTKSQTTENPGSAHQLTTLFYAVGALNILKRLIQSAARSLEPNWVLELMNDTTLSSLQGNEWAWLPKISASESKHTDFY